VKADDGRTVSRTPVVHFVSQHYRLPGHAIGERALPASSRARGQRKGST